MKGKERNGRSESVVQEITDVKLETKENFKKVCICTRGEKREIVKDIEKR